ncbi:MAG TPA: M15 family metallopeptidase, partial [Acidimicrobiia bacterium]|nr:M15 family metallopeptidase [Acidimicrobiia bacterium]
MSRIRLAALAAVVTLGATAVTVPERADAAAAPTLPSFTESGGCEGAQGTRGPYASKSGGLSSSEPILGPWGDVYGRTIGEVRSRLVPVTLPMMDWPRQIWIHESVKPAFDAVVANLEAEIAKGRWYSISGSNTGGFRPETVPPGRHLSFHAVGAAIDVNVHRNPYRADNVLVTDMPGWFVKAWTDAGWCWGGDWQTIKDSMHFAWNGPLADPGPRTPPPPLSAPAAFETATVLRAGWPTESGAFTPLVGDVDRDGAPDIVRAWSWTPDGRMRLEAAVAHHDYETCVAYDVTEGPPPMAPPVLADADADGRPDLWSIDTNGATVAASVWSHASSYRDHRAITTSIPTASLAAVLPGDRDRDGVVDLYVVRHGSPTTVEVWRGPSWSLDTTFTLPVATTASWRFALGDRDVDGILDVYALGPSGALHIGSGASSLTSVETRAITVPAGSFTVGDLDGDGRDDLLFHDAQGALTALHGGRRTDGLGTSSWWSGSWDRHWIAGDDCVSGRDRGDLDRSEDGRFLVYATNVDGPGDANGAGDVVVEDTVAGTTEIVSVASDGTPAGGLRCGRWCSREPAISADGRYVAFTS